MKETQSLYQELISHCKLYLAQEYSTTDRIIGDFETVEYFRKSIAAKLSQPKDVKQAPNQAEPQPPAHAQIPQAQNPSPSQPRQFAQPTQPTPPGRIAPSFPNRTPSKPSKPPMGKPIMSESPPEKQGWTLEPIGPMEHTDNTSLKKILEGGNFELPIVNDIPDDSKAKQLLNSWKIARLMPAVTVLLFDEPARYQTFLSNLAKAIQLHLAPAEIVPIHSFDPHAPTIRLIIATETGLNRDDKLKKLYHESQKGERTLGKVPLVLLSDLSLYFKEPRLKVALWEEIRRITR